MRTSRLFSHLPAPPPHSLCANGFLLDGASLVVGNALAPAPEHVFIYLYVVRVELPNAFAYTLELTAMFVR